ncbi:MAG: hypothetical protein IT162_18600 [Bryobacterales bacterium]|nr:hypothetical protein [Bryobacterales bacterium]
MWFRGFVFLLITHTGFCQSAAADLALPALGYVLDTSGAGQIRPITGIPGAALVGPPLSVAFPATSLATSSRASLALASTGTAGDLMLVRDGAAQVFEQGAGAPAFALSPSGQAAVSSRAAAEEDEAALAPVKIWDRLDRPATAEWTMPTPCPSPRWAIADDGRRTVAACSGTSALLWTDGQPRSAPLMLTAFAFLAESHAGVGVDAAGDLHWLDEAGNWSLLRTQWVETPAARNIALLATRRWVLAVAGSTVLRLDRETSESERFDCSCPVTGLHATPVSGVVRLTQAAGPSAVYLFDAGTGRFWFVPSLEAAQ